MCTVETKQKIHVFEAADLGLAPFEFIGMQHQEISYGQRVIGNAGGCALTTKPGGTCAYCGKYILNIFNVRSADGRRFHVGSDCVLKTGDAGLRDAVNSALKEKKRIDKETIAIAARGEAEKWVAAHRYLLGEMPHPCIPGKSYLDYLNWLEKHSTMGAYVRAVRNAKAQYDSEKEGGVA